MRRIKQFLAFGLTVLVLMSATGMVSAQTVQAPSAPIITVNPIILKDKAQDKNLALRITLPMRGTRLPIVLFSHGASYSKDDYLPLTEFWATQGYVVIQPTHIESVSLGLARDDERIKSAWKSRALDMRHILNALDEIVRQVPLLKGRMDRSHVIAAGHSFGGHTSAALLSARLPDVDADLRDPRISAALIIAPPGLAPGFLNLAWDANSKPMLIIVGHEDVTKGFVERWEQHADYYYKGPSGACLAVMAGVKHYMGGILGTNRTEELTPNPQSLAEVQRISLAFLNAEAKGGKDWNLLKRDMADARSASVDIFECK